LPLSSLLLSISGAPLQPGAVAGDQQAVVSFTTPPQGGSSIASYTVTSTPGNLQATGAKSPITVSSLVNGVEYTFKVSARNVFGTGVASVASNGVTPVGVPNAPYAPVAVGRSCERSCNFYCVLSTLCTRNDKYAR
jgi:hypothetical protein